VKRARRLRLDLWAGVVVGFSLFCVVGCSPLPTNTGSPVLIGSGGQFHVGVSSLQSRVFIGVVHQERDFSCGSAAVATLLSFHYRDPVAEHVVLLDMLQPTQHDLQLRAKIQKQGFSMLDMRHFLQRRGYMADGYSLSLDELQNVGVPAIVLIEINGYKHFVVVKGISDRAVLVGDPALGLRTVSKTDFKAMWKGPTLLIKSKASIGRLAFNQKSEWDLKAPPMDQALSRESLQEFTVSLPRLGDFKER